MTSVLRSERDVIEMMAGKTVTLQELYAACEAAQVTDRADGTQAIDGHGRDTVWRRRVRGALQTLRRSGRATRVGDASWVIAIGDRERPERMLHVPAPRELDRCEMVLSDAADFLRETDEPFDLIVADPPYGLAQGTLDDPTRDRGERLYKRDANIVPGYQEVVPDRYGEFTHRWVEAAAAALRPGAYLVVVTGTSVAWRIGHAAHDAGLTQVCQIAAQRRFALRTTRQPAYAHWVITVLISGALYSNRRFFHSVPELPKAASGRDYPLDLWCGTEPWPAGASPKADRPGRLRYRNSLPTPLVDRIVRMFSRGPDSGGAPWEALVADPFLGGGTTAVAALRNQRRFRGADRNPESLRFTAARLTIEERLT